jgi:endonuclease/exonuclease/phosphatase family metal-dependent hydrolase
MNHLFLEVPSVGFSDISSVFKQGNAIAKQQEAILAKIPAQSAWAEPWKSMEGIDPPRGFAFASFKVRDAEIGVYCVHLKNNLVMRGDKTAEAAKNMRKREVAADQLLAHMHDMIAKAMPSVKAFIVGGDFNANKDQEMFAAESSLAKLDTGGFRSCFGGLLKPNGTPIPANIRFRTQPLIICSERM